MTGKTFKPKRCKCGVVDYARARHFRALAEDAPPGGTTTAATAEAIARRRCRCPGEARKEHNNSLL